MTLSTRDRRALLFLGVAGILGLAIRFWPEDSAPAPVSTVTTVDQAEKRLAHLREIAATVPGKEAVLKTVNAELASREKGLIRGDTAAQAQAQVLQLARKLALAEGIEIRATELGPTAQFGDAYGAINVSLQMECRLEQLINMISALSQQPELISTSDLRIASGSAKDKTIGVRLTVTGIVPGKLVPGKKGGA